MANKSEWQQTIDDIFAGKRAIKEVASTENYGRVKFDGATIVTDVDGKIKVSDDFVAKGIDNLQAKSHEHNNKNLLDTYNQTNINLTDAVNKKHTHENLGSLNKLSVNENNELLINDVVYTPKIIKEYCFARRTASHLDISVDTDIVFNTVVDSNITYDNSAGLFYLKAGKTYRVTMTSSINTDSWVKLSMVEGKGVNVNAQTAEAPNTAIWTSVTATYNEASCGPLDLIITPTTSRYFKIRCTDAGNGSHALRYAYSSLLIQEI